MITTWPHKLILYNYIINNENMWFNEYVYNGDGERIVKFCAQTVSQSNNQSIRQAATLPINHSTNSSVNSFENQSAIQSISQLFKNSFTPPICQPYNQSDNKPITEHKSIGTTL